MSLLTAVAGRRIVFVGGKGGVGKTTTSAALGLAMAASGRRCLVVSTDPAHSLGDIFERGIGDLETALAPNLWGLEVDSGAQADRYISSVKQNMKHLLLPAMYGEIDRQMDLARETPGAVEAALMERVAELMRDGTDRYDCAIFDTAPTGHTLRLLALPEVMAAWTDGLLKHREKSGRLARVLERLRSGPEQGGEFSVAGGDKGAAGERDQRIYDLLLERRRKFHTARRLLLDADTTAYVLVLIPERLPIAETRQSLHTLKQHGVPVAALVVNRVLPDNVGGEFWHTRREREQGYLREIQSLFPEREPIYLPLLAHDVLGVDDLHTISTHLTEG